MKKIGLLCLALVLALGALGVGYAKWTDTVTIGGPVTTGSVCLEFVQWSVGGPYLTEEEDASGFDYNWVHWTPLAGSQSCPPGGTFGDPVVETKDVGKLGTVTPVMDNDHCIALDVTIDNAYPYYYCLLKFKLKNCGTIPLKLKAPVFTQDDSLRIEYFDGGQVEPGVPHEVSLAIGVTERQDTVGDGEDDTKPLTPQKGSLSFTIAIEGEQWAE